MSEETIQILIHRYTFKMRLTSKTNVFCNIGFMHFNEAITSTESDGKNKKKYSTYSRYRKILFRRSHFNVDTIPIIIFPCYYFYYYFFFFINTYTYTHTTYTYIYISFFSFTENTILIVRPSVSRPS